MIDIVDEKGGIKEMPRYFVHATFFLFMVTAVSGMWMRWYPFLSNPLIAYDHVLHGHSHLAILGWAFLGVFIIFLAILWPQIENKRHATFLMLAIFTVSILMFIAFLYEGYAMYSIIMSTIHIFVEYWAIVYIYRQLKTQDHHTHVGKLFIHGSLIALFISTLAPFGLGYLGAMGLQETDLFDMTIYIYLHFQYNGWLFLFLIGLFIFIINQKRIKLQTTAFRIGFWIYLISLFPWSLSAISYVGLSPLLNSLAAIGLIGQSIGVLFILYGMGISWKPIRRRMAKITSLTLLLTFLLLFFKSVMELGLLSPYLAKLVFNTRSVIIGYLHFTLLGFISLFILTQLQMIKVIDTNRKLFSYGITIFLAGWLMNELYLFIMGLMSWIGGPSLPFYTEGLLFASILLCIGVSFIWVSYMRKKKKLS